jgi:hypothetical protein
MIHVVAVPQRLENGVRKTEGKDILHGLLAQVVIDTVDLLLSENLVDLRIQAAGALQVMPKGLLDDDPGPPR